MWLDFHFVRFVAKQISERLLRCIYVKNTKEQSGFYLIFK